MESNGKQTDRSGNLVNYETGQIIWGQTGTNAQHSFFQFLHQGTKITPLDFIGFSNPIKGNKQHHNILMANFFAQTKALMFGTNDKETDSNHKLFKGDRPTNTILIRKLTPRSLGSLISMYEHKIFSLGVIWNILSFDQFGVELGKKLANNILKDIENQDFNSHDSSTRNLLNRYLSTD
jgi:glucose-6-phosphate isomerase